MPPRKSRLIEPLLFRYVRGLAASTFHAVRVAGGEHLRNLPPASPVLALANHSSWWDGFMIHLLTRTAPARNFFCMMEERQLSQFPFLTRIGAFSVDLSSPTRSAVSLRFTLRLLSNPAHLVW
ncbi:MAG: lysophospholipid acyltransferase family protein, partial [Verrucomicrobiia bacterium]